MAFHDLEGALPVVNCCLMFESLFISLLDRQIFLSLGISLSSIMLALKLDGIAPDFVTKCVQLGCS